MPNAEDIWRVSIKDKEYPESLKAIPNPPAILYYRGSFITHGERLFGIVGTRRPSDYGRQAALYMAGALADAGFAIVSGMAPGIDTWAHKACVEKGGRTIAVMGTGVDSASIYPRDNLQLSQEIIARGGCLVSELPPGTHGSAITFPHRNRIISGLSEGVLVVEAKEKSGSLITANYARLQGKKLFALPGQIFSANAAGPHQLIQQGAMLAQSPDDIFAALDAAPPKAQKTLIAENSEEAMIIQSLKEGPADIDKIIEKTKLDAPAAMRTLALMEISGKIRSLGGSVYAIA